MNPKRTIHPALAALVVIVLIGIVTTVVIVVTNANNNESADPVTQESSLNQEETTQSPSSTDVTGFKNGSYDAVVSYVTPGGVESIDLNVTISEGVITDTQIAASGSSDHAQEHQQDFADTYKPLVVGKSITEVELSRVAGASLTTNAFNDAIEQIKLDAEA